MKKILRFAVITLLCLVLMLSFCSCSLLNAFVSGEGAEVTFVIGDKEKKVSVPFGAVVSPPKTPTADGRIFAGWYTDSDYAEEYDFSSPVYADFSLYARFVLDGAALTNQITLQVMPALVTVENVYRISLGKELVAQGSGFLYKIENGRAFVLTNCHVAYSPTATQAITVEDFRGEKHEATIYQKFPSASPAISAKYDLAILTFPYEGSDLATIPFASQSVKNGDGVISLGSPENQSHAITFGEMLGLRKANLEDSSKEETNVTFDIIYHSAAINSGSSGGPLLNGDLELVGVNYAGIPSEEGSDGFGHGCAVPLEKIREFLSVYE